MTLTQDIERAVANSATGENYQANPSADDNVASLFTDLGARVEAVLSEVRQRTPLAEVRQALNDAGIVRARGVLHDSVDIIAHALDDLRDRQAAEREAKERYEANVVAAEWELGACFVTESNKTYLLLDEYEVIDLSPPDQPGTNVTNGDRKRRQINADERRSWIAKEARTDADVMAAEKTLRLAESETAASRDGIELAKVRFSIAKHDCDAAIAIVTIHAAALGGAR